MRFKLPVGIFFAAVCFAQEWEVGGFIGYGWYNNGTIVSPAETVRAGIGNSWDAGFVLGEDLYQHLSGEFRWLFQNGDPFLSGPGFRGDINGSSHTFTYDIVVNITSKEHRIRPFLAAGGGGKYYVASEPAFFVQPAPAVATLIGRNTWRGVGDFGGGVKFVVRRHIILRADFRDYVTGLPHGQIVPAIAGARHGTLHMLTPMFGVSGWF